MLRGGLRLALGIGAALVLLVVVAVASASRSTTGVEETTATAIFDDAAAETFFTAGSALLFVATLALAIVVILRIMANREPPDGESDQMSVPDIEVPWWLRLLIGGLLAAVTLVSIVLIIRMAGALRHDALRPDADPLANL